MPANCAHRVAEQSQTNSTELLVEGCKVSQQSSPIFSVLQSSCTAWRAWPQATQSAFDTTSFPPQYFSTAARHFLLHLPTGAGGLGGVGVGGLGGVGAGGLGGEGGLGPGDG